MIIYSYQCNKCFHHFTKLYSKVDSEQLYCPSCGSTEVNTQPDQSFSNYLNSCLEKNRLMADKKPLKGEALLRKKIRR